MKKKIFSCKSMIHRSIPLNNLNYYNLIISCLSICYYSFFSCGTSLTEKVIRRSDNDRACLPFQNHFYSIANFLTERNIYLCGTIQATFGIGIKRSSQFWKKKLGRFTFGIDKQKGNFNPNINGG